MSTIAATNSEPPYKRWIVLLGLSLTYAATNGILVHTLPLIYPQLIDEFSWTQSQVTLPATVFLVVNALTSIPAGVLLDRLSARMIISMGLVAIAAGLVGYAYVTELWQLVAVYTLMAVGLSACGLVSNMLILSRWFVALRGRATGILLMSSSAGGVMFPLVLGSLLEAGGWRSAMLVLAGVVVVIALLPMLTIVRDRPRSSEVVSAEPAAPPGLKGPTVRDALTDRRFYLIAIATGAVWFTLIGMTQHQSIYLAKDMGFDARLLPTVFSTFFAMSVVGKLLFGWLSDHFDKMLMMVTSIALLAVSLMLLRNVDAAGNVSLYGYAVIGGIGFSGAFTMIQLMFANFYAGDSFGKILAILMLVDTLSGAAGTRIIALMRESDGSYLPAINLMMGLLLLAATCVLLARPKSIATNA